MPNNPSVSWAELSRLTAEVHPVRNTGFFSTTAHMAANSVKSTLANAKLTDAVATGDVDSEDITQLLNALKVQSQQTQSLSTYELQNTFNAADRRAAYAKTSWEKAKVFFDIVATTLEQPISNPVGVIQTGVQSVGNIIPSMTGGLAGAEAGALLGPAGSAAGAIGGFIGSLAGGLSTEAGARLVQETQQRLQELKLAPTEENLTKIFQDKAWARTAIKKSRLKAVGTALPDAILSGVLGKFASTPERLATRMGTVAAGEGASEAVLKASIGKELGLITKLDKLKYAAPAYVGETISEPLTEWTGGELAGDKFKPSELMAEFLGGIGTSMVTTPTEKAIYGGLLGKDIAKIATRKIGDARKRRKYQAGLREDIKNGNVEQHFDKTNEDYDPIRAIDVSLLQAQAVKDDPIKQQEFLMQAHNIHRDVINDYNAAAIKLAKLGQAIEAKQKANEELTEKDKVDYSIALYEMERLRAGVELTGKTIAKADRVEATPKAVKKDLKKAVEAGDNEAVKAGIVKAIGSKSRGNDLGTVIDLEAASKNTALDEVTRNTLAHLHKYELSKQAVLKKQERIAKTSDEVHEDVFNGIGKYTGINKRHQLITAALEKGDFKEAQFQYQQLVNFGQMQKDKYDAFVEAIHQVQGTSTATEEQKAKAQETLNRLNTERQANGQAAYSINNKAFKYNITDNVGLELDAINSGIELAQDLFKLHGQEAVTENDITSFKRLSNKIDDAIPRPTSKPVSQPVTTEPGQSIQTEENAKESPSRATEFDEDSIPLHANSESENTTKPKAKSINVFSTPYQLRQVNTSEQHNNARQGINGLLVQFGKSSELNEAHAKTLMKMANSNKAALTKSEFNSLRNIANQALKNTRKLRKNQSKPKNTNTVQSTQKGKSTKEQAPSTTEVDESDISPWEVTSKTKEPEQLDKYHRIKTISSTSAEVEIGRDGYTSEAVINTLDHSAGFIGSSKTKGKNKLTGTQAVEAAAQGKPIEVKLTSDVTERIAKNLSNKAIELMNQGINTVLTSTEVNPEIYAAVQHNMLSAGFSLLAIADITMEELWGNESTNEQTKESRPKAQSQKEAVQEKEATSEVVAEENKSNPLEDIPLSVLQEAEVTLHSLDNTVKSENVTATEALSELDKRIEQVKNALDCTG